MTQERDRPEAVQHGDDAVSRAYRNTAVERAPEHLNQAVLRQARAASRPGYARSVAWTRPLAWAATITLCLALVLELTRTPQIMPVDFDAQGPLPDAATPQLPPAAARRDEVAASDLPAAKLELGSNSGEPAATADYETRERDSGGTTADAGPAAPETAMRAFRPEDSDSLRQAEELVRLQSSAGLDKRPAERDAAQASGFAAGSLAAGCDEKATAAPETWLECIETLESAGETAEAGRQRQLLVQAFPDFEMQ
jgi:hypothetical protein